MKAPSSREKKMEVLCRAVAAPVKSSGVLAPPAGEAGLLLAGGADAAGAAAGVVV